MALTFDDGPYIYTSHILDLLTQYNASATFFITGNNNGKGHIDNASLAWPSLIKRMYDDGHQLASHTWSHPDLCNITSAQRKNEMWKNEMALRNVVGVIPTYMRPPYSSCTAECGCEGDMEDLGYHITYFVGTPLPLAPCHPSNPNPPLTFPLPSRSTHKTTYTTPPA